MITKYLLKWKFNTFHSLLLLAFNSGIQSGIIRVSFTLWLKSCGMGIAHLALFNLITLPASFKVFWLPIMESLNLKEIFASFSYSSSQYSKQNMFGHRKLWILLLDALIVLMTLSLCLLQPQYQTIKLLLPYATLFSAIITSRESMAIAYQMETIKKEDLGPLEGKINAFQQTGFWISSYLIFSLSSYITWQFLFFCVAVILALCLVLTLFISESTVKHIHTKTFKEKFIEPYKDLINQNKHILIPMILFMTLYRLQDRLLTSVTSYFFIDLGFGQHFIFGKTLGLGSAVFGGFLGSYCVKRFNYKQSLVIGMVGHIMASSLLLVQSIWFPTSHVLFYVITLSEKFTRGFEATIFFTYQMLFCNKQYAVAQYSILAALDRISSTLIASLSGYLISYFGWNWFFIFSFVATVPSLLFLRKLPDGEKSTESTKH